MASTNISELHDSIKDVLSKVDEAKKRRKESHDSDVCVVAVSKTKPKELIIEAYNCGMRHFGENYVNELVDKASDPEILEMCPDIKWHFIGHLQSNKVVKVIGAPNLHMIQTVDSVKLADIIDQKWAATGKSGRLNIMVQVNTSGETGKSGISPDQLQMLLKHISQKCSHLNCVGLMTIGLAGIDLTSGSNPDFETLVKCRKSLSESLSSEITSSDHKFMDHCELSMGMSDDYEHAIEMGSTCVRVGRCLFGARAKKEN